jgi:hypothetical protein
MYQSSPHPDNNGGRNTGNILAKTIHPEADFYIFMMSKGLIIE